MVKKQNLRKTIASTFLALCLAFITGVAINNGGITASANIGGASYNSAVNATYVITYKQLDGTEIATENFSGEMVLDGAALLTAPVIEGKTFYAWYDGAKKIDTIKDIGLRNVDLYAIYVGDFYTATFYLGDSTTTQIVLKGGKAVGFIPEREGYSFKGWANEQGATYNFNSVLTSDVKIIATWTAINDVNTETVPAEDAKINASTKNAINVLPIICYAVLGVGAVLLVVAIILRGKKRVENGDKC